MLRSITRLCPRLFRPITGVSPVVGSPRRHLPYCALSASTPEGELPHDLAQGLSTVLAKTLDKPEKVSEFSEFKSISQL